MSGQALPRKRFRRRGPGLLTSDTDLQKRLNALMRQTNSEEVLLCKSNPLSSATEKPSRINFSQSILPRLALMFPIFPATFSIHLLHYSQH